MIRMKRAAAIWLGIALLLSLLNPYATVLATEQPSFSFGQVLDNRRMELAPGAVYNWYDMRIDRGLEKVHTVEFDPANPMLELQAGTKAGKVYGMQGVTEMAKYADKEGNRVIAGINGDFYDLSDYGTGVPNGLFMGEGKILNSPDSNYEIFVLNEDGTTQYGPMPKLTKTITIDGKTDTFTHINRHRLNNQLILYTSDYADSTKTTNLGDEVVLDVLEGDVRSGQTMQLKVSEVRKDQGDTPLAAGKVVLSAQGTARTVLAGLEPGDEVTAYFELENGWQNAKVAMSGRLLMKDGVVLDNVAPEGVHPRTAIGTKADGTIVMMEVDGRAPGFSEGVETSELGQIMKNLGVVNALNLDGGGSSTFVARLPGEPTFKMLNRGSDGGERSTGNSLLLVNKAATGPAAKLIVQPNFERVLAGTKLKFATAAVDATGHLASMEGTPTWSVSSEFGAMDDSGTFTAGTKAGTTSINVSAGGLSGSGEVEVVTELTELQFPDMQKAIDSGATVPLSVTALRNGQKIVADNAKFTWREEGDIGSVDSDGVFHATTESGKNGKIIVNYGSIEASMIVNVGTPPVILEDFESGLDRYVPTAGANYNKALVTITTEDEYVRSGNQALKLEYDFIGKTGTTGAYLQTKGKEYYLAIPGYPQKISMWVYGDGSGNWLRAQMRDKDGSGGATPINFTEETTGVNWKGWKYVEADVPTGLTAPLRIDLPVRYMTTSKNPPVKGAGAIYVDNIRALYGPAQDDIDPPIIKDIEPAEGSTVKTSTPAIRAFGEDQGYDPQIHPGTTLIDPDKIFVYVDNVLVPHTLYPPEGRISYKPDIPLADGVHKAKIQIRDLSGNRTEKEWTFSVDTGSSRFEYNTPAEIYAGNTYTLDIKGSKVAGIHAGEIGFAFDMSKVDSLQVIPGTKLTESQVQADLDMAKGTVLLKFTDLDTAALTDEDLLAQIQYRVKPEVEGTHTISFTSGKISFTGSAGDSSVFFGLPRESAIKHHLKLSWDSTSVVEGYTTNFTVSDENGAPVEGAQVVADGVELGLTDAQGMLATNELTKTVKSYTLQATKDTFYSSIVSFTVSPLAGTTKPYNISVTMGEDPATSRGFNWHTHPSVTETVVEITEKSGFTDFDGADVLKVNGSNELFTTFDIGTVRVHKAVAEHLKPDTEYVYRVGDGMVYSDQGSFRTAPLTGEQVKFMFFGDSQAADQPGYALWGNTVDQAVKEMPDADFMVHAGDMVDNGYKENEWNMWFEAVQQELMKTTFVAIVGNHEVTGNNGNNDFLSHFTQPGNGLDNLKGSNFSFDYKNVHFVVLNSEYNYAEQKEWLRKDLAATDKKWKIVAFHRGPYGSIYDTQVVREEWTPVFDEFKVDLVLNGHDHIYLRNTMKNGEKVDIGEGTAYVVAGSTGPKFYGLTRRDWTQFVDEEMTQMYAAVEIDGDQLTFVMRTVGGREVDRFVLEKKEAEQVIVDQTDVKLSVGATVQLNAQVLPEDAADKSLVWSVFSSSVEDVVTVSNDGRVTALHEGTAIVRVTQPSSGVYAECLVTVSESNELASIELHGHASLYPGSTDLTVTEGVYASGKRFLLPAEDVDYRSSNPDVATIGASGEVFAHEIGETTITASYKGFEDSYVLTVTKQPAVMTRITVSGLTELRVGGTDHAVTKAVYSDASDILVTEGVDYSSSDSDVATIDANGLVTAHQIGETTITASYKGFEDNYELTVTKQPAVLTGIKVSGVTQLRVGGTDHAVTKAVYSDASDMIVTEGVDYSSSDPYVASVDTEGNIKALKRGIAEITASYDGYTDSYTMTVKAKKDDDNDNSGSESDPTPPATQQPEPGLPQAPADGEAQPGSIEVQEDELIKRIGEGNTVFKLQTDFSELVLPGNTPALLQDQPVTVEAVNLSVSIPGAVLRSLTELIPAEQRAGSHISLQATTVSEAEKRNLLQQAEEKEGAAIEPAGELLEFTLTITTEEGSVSSLSKFNEPILLTLKANPSADRRLTGIYYIQDNGELEYVGGTWNNGAITAPIEHFSKYSVLQYHKSFSDIRSAYWASDVIQELAAKQMITGVSETQFAPEQQVTRAEFAAMLVRMLHLEDGEQAFADVSPDKWYAEDVARAFQAGIIQGVTADSFAPDATINRQEMAVMLVRAYHYANGKVDDSQAEAPLADITSAPAWAQEAIHTAYSLGLIHGRTESQFQPEANATRAESAQVMYNLLLKLQESK